MVQEKFNILRQIGHIHLFKNEDLHFLYSRENNHTYQIDEKTALALVDEHATSSDLQNAENFFNNYLKRDVKPRVRTYSLYIQDGINLEIHLDALKKNIFSHIQSELIFNESNPKYSNESFSRITAALMNVSRSDLVFIKEKSLLSLNVKSDKKDVEENRVRLLYDIDLAAQIAIPELTQITGHISVEYNPDRNVQLYKLLGTNDVTVRFYIRDKDQTHALLDFLLTTLKSTSGISKRIYNFYSIANYLISKMIFDSTLAKYDGKEFIDVDNRQCNECWAKSICWATKSYKIFNIDLFDVPSHSSQCDAIKSIIENTIVKLRQVEKTRNANKPNQTDNGVYDFDGVEIKLIN